MSRLSNTTAAEFGVTILQAVHDKLPYSEIDQRRFLVRSIALLRSAPANMALVREAEQFMRTKVPSEVERATLANRLHPRLLHALQNSVRAA